MRGWRLDSALLSLVCGASLCLCGASAFAWGDEGHEVIAGAKLHAYGLLPPPAARDHYELSARYVSDATAVTAEQLSKAGVRLAWLLNQSLH